MAKYLLAPHTYACITGNQAVFLDLERDKYTAVEPDDTRKLTYLVRGWPSIETADDAPPAALPEVPDSRGHSSVVQMLLDEGLLTDDTAIGKSFPEHAIEPVSKTVDAVCGWFPKIDLVDLGRFVKAWVLISVLMKLVPLKLILQRVLRRKQARAPFAPPFDERKAHALVTAYFILRPNFFNANAQCLRDSLTFIEFVAQYDMHPTLVFGVRMQPFAAHAWVQEGPMVLNDYIRNVTRYTGIMAV